MKQTVNERLREQVEKQGLAFAVALHKLGGSMPMSGADVEAVAGRSLTIEGPTDDKGSVLFKLSEKADLVGLAAREAQ